MDDAVLDNVWWVVEVDVLHFTVSGGRTGTGSFDLTINGSLSSSDNAIASVQDNNGNREMTLYIIQYLDLL